MQLAIALILSFFFFSLQLSVGPFKLNQDNFFRASTECHVFLVLVAALMMRTEPVGYEDALYDWVLSVTFIVLVPGAFVATVVSKVRFALKAQSSSGVDAAFNRFRLGLAIGTDCAALFTHFEQLRSELEPVGLRLWRNKELVTHLEPDQMKAALSELSNRLPKSQALGYHFTDIDSARMILHSQGIRASTVGQLGGGVSICLTSPVALGWTKFGGKSFAKRTGEALWGSKWREVMSGPAPAGGFNETALRKELVRAIYEDHAPEKLDDVSELLSSWAGREDQLLSSLREKYNVQGRYKVEDPNADWGKAANKLEVMLALRVPSKDNRDKMRLVPGRPSIYIVPRTLCEPGTGSDTTNVYLPNREIEKVFILRSPDSTTQQKELELAAVRTEAVRVQCKSNRNSNDGMSDVIAVELKELESAEDKVIVDPAKSWCPVVASFTATVAKPLDTAAASLRAHQQIQEANSDKQLWPENIARFSTDEMAAAVHTIDQSMPQTYTLAHFFTSSDEASELYKGSKGVAATPQPDGRLGVRVSLRSPDELGWEKNAGGAFLDTAGNLMFGPHWRETNSKQLQAVLILGIPTDQMPADGADTFVIPEALLVADGVANNGEMLLVGDNSSETVAKGTPYYSSAHVYKVYLLQRTTAADHCAIDIEHTDLPELFALVDADGDGNVSKEEAKQYLRKERQVDLDAHSIDVIWQALDDDGNGTLDISEFPRFLEVVDKEIARVAAAVDNPQLHATPTSVALAAQKVADQVESVVMDDKEVQAVRISIQHMLAALPDVSLPTEAELRDELSGLRLKGLKARAKDLGIDEDRIDEAEDADDVQGAILELVVSATPVMSIEQADMHHPAVSLVSELPALLEAISRTELKAALDAQDFKAAIMQLLLGASQKSSDPILVALQAGGEPLSDMVAGALEGALEVLEQHSSASPRKARRAVRLVIERVEAALESIDDTWCEAISQSNELKLAARLLAEVQSSTGESSGVDVSSGLVELLDCLDRCGGVRGGGASTVMDQAPPTARFVPQSPALEDGSAAPRDGSAAPKPLSRQPPALPPPRSATPPRKANPKQSVPNTARSQRAKMLELRLEKNAAGGGSVRRSATPPRAKP
eukprot:COSAG06_NODE_2402_length_6947_cov_4.005111_5_plen_1113_part_00